jgi:hypothetical protein
MIYCFIIEYVFLVLAYIVYIAYIRYIDYYIEYFDDFVVYARGRGKDLRKNRGRRLRVFRLSNRI